MQMMQSHPPYHSRPTTENNIVHVPVVDISSLSEETLSTASDTAIMTGEVTSLTGDDDRNAAEDLFEVLKERGVFLATSSVLPFVQMMHHAI